MPSSKQRYIPTYHFHRFTLVIVLLSSCGLALAAQQSSAKQSAPTDYKLQVLKDCKLLSERALTAAELDAWQNLKKAELKMDQLQIPLDQMSKALEPHQDKMEQLSAELELQTKRDRMPDETLLEQTRMTAERIEDITDSYQGDIDAISSYGDEISKVAKTFEQQITAQLPQGSYDQLRVLKPGEQPDKNCQSGMFFSKSLHFNKNKS
ncbi:hypothetical protein [Rheinheimera sp. F8]|uniref:hypothetical protein n=1 Tax=Rheinheimera sp. F8 TaxID=1763998 RepID=UPI000744B730|nr:hypothetical protein [Rheinheimera sp. F8]ALZ76868.1 hypothetical protein ATY27_14600 [Rheinheimera sp. F8]